MISATKIKEMYEHACGYTLYNDSGSVTEAVRKKNEIVYPVCGLFKMQPVQLTAIKSPFIGIASANVEIIAPTHMMEEVRTTLNTNVVTFLNGKTFDFSDEKDNGKSYSVSFTVQTCTVGEKADIGAWYGECVTLYQTISFVIIEEGVSSYDVTLKIDGMDVPILSLSETKVHTTSVYPSANAIGHTASEQEAYGIDFATPYINNNSCKIFREALNGRTGNTAHCVEITKNETTDAYIMAISAVADSVQPPSNVGFNVSLTEVSPTIARFDGNWEIQVFTGDIINYNPSGVSSGIVFWGDGSSEDFVVGYNRSHTYNDGKNTHDVILYMKSNSAKTMRLTGFGDTSSSMENMRPIKCGDDLFGKEITVCISSETGRASATDIIGENEDGEHNECLMLFGTFEDENTPHNNADALYCDGTRIYQQRPNGDRFYIDTAIDGSYWLEDGQKFTCTVNGPLSYIWESDLYSFFVSRNDVPAEVIVV